LVGLDVVRLNKIGLFVQFLFLMSLVLQTAQACTLRFHSGLELTHIALAHTPQTQAIGLSGSQPIEGGMLFVWSDTAVRQFWMKDTFVPLRLYYLDADATITQITAMQPKSMRKHYSAQPARYALELPEDQATQIALTVGDRLESVVCGG
jgi:hypothetical protein